MSQSQRPSNRPRPDSRSYLVGRDAEGHWVAVDQSGRAGGLFRSRHDAVRFACVETGCAPDDVPVASRTIAVPL